jgi:sugar phosphate isomerase/epimerase
MTRRDLLEVIAATATVSLARPLAAQTAPAGKFSLDVFSRHLQWLRTPQEVAKAAIEVGLHSIDLTVMPYPGHVDPKKVKTDLPAFAKGLREGGVSVSAVTCPITDADSPDAQAIIATAASLGIHNYSWQGLRYNEGQPYPPQLDAIKSRVARLARINEKYGIRALYQPAIGAANVGAAFFDLLQVLKDFDPRFVAFRYDTGSLAQITPDLQALQLRWGGRYIGGIALNDAAVSLDLPVWKQGAYTGTPEQQIGSSRGGDNVGTDGGNPLAIGGGGRPLPYHVHPVPIGNGMANPALIGSTLKEIGFDGPAECQTTWPMGGAEHGDDKITLPRQTVVGQIKHNRLIVEAAFASAWNLEIARPAFMEKAAGGRGPAQPR